MIIREQYLKKIRPFYDTDLVKVIVGIRRSGKSIIMEQIMNEIRKISDNIIYLNFERNEDLLKVNNGFELVKYINSTKKKGKCYIFLDEIQEVEDWAKGIKDLRLDDNSIFITGSNSKILSSEILTLLSGRFISFRVRPFVFKEIKEYSQMLNKDYSIYDYLTWGGFPFRFRLDNLESQKEYLEELEETIIYNDLIKRYRIKKELIFRKIVQFILSSNSRIVSARSIYRVIKQEYQDISLNTVIKYIEYLKNAYIIDSIPKYSPKTKDKLTYLYKIYNSDVSFNSLMKQNNRYDYDHNLENIVYNELLYKGYKVTNYDNNGKEIDFYVTKNSKEYFIQVTYSLNDEKTYEREFKAFNNLPYTSRKIIISLDEVDYSTSLIEHIKLKDFLEMDEL